jgi:hypothetical protein
LERRGRRLDDRTLGLMFEYGYRVLRREEAASLKFVK